MMRWIFAALLLIGVHKVSTASPWIYADDDEVPKDAIRITSLGSGTPDVHKEQVATGFLIEVGNGDKFIFDLGSGAFLNLFATGVPPSKLDKVFLTHLHSDHLADLATLQVNAIFGRKTPLQVWGPSGESPQYGLEASIDGLRKFLAWDTLSRRRINLIGRKDDGDQLIAHEFDYSVEKQLIYSQNGVNITSTPTRLTVGDSIPANTLVELARGCDVFIEGIIGPLPDLDVLSWQSRFLINTSHTTPAQAGRIFRDVGARLSVIHHADVNDASREALITETREEYPEGRLVINEDLAVYEVTKDAIRHRKRIVPVRSWGKFERAEWARRDDAPSGQAHKSLSSAA
ncbi:hypothetical protein WJX75_006483 [Coccomyxa subellipsoidea]|uniref:Metallo-beta-lactamase domain-containing protein n=1 Tax=Coccomyxa subellipsoidea TaxID=248742 RepID=A0ABR2YN80_9CHLO